MDENKKKSPEEEEKKPPEAPAEEEKDMDKPDETKTGELDAQACNRQVHNYQRFLFSIQ